MRWTSNPVRLGTEGRPKARSCTDRRRAPVADQGQGSTTSSGEEARLIGAHRNSEETTYEDRQRPRIPTASVNPREENRTADRSDYLDRYTIGGCASREWLVTSPIPAVS